ncbi:MAG: POTRA domain-containing protein [Ignavibacteriaceae bacterium]
MLQKKITNTFIFILLLTAAVYSQQNVQYELTSINFIGNNSFSSKGLKQIILSKESPSWFWKFLNSFSSFGNGPEYFDSASIPIDLLALKDFYKSNGYFEAKFSSSYKIDTAKKSANLTYKITEGHLFTYINKAITVLMNEGYMLASFDSALVYIDTTDYKVNLNIFLHTGYRYKINHILIDKTGSGKNLVSDELLRQITLIRQDDYYNQDKIQKSQYRLARTGLFNSVQLNADIADTAGSKVPLMLKGNIGLLNEMSPENSYG